MMPPGVREMFKKKEQQRVNFEEVDTIIGSGSEFQGTIVVQGTLRVDGRVSGDIHVQGDLIVGEKGQVNANIKARHVTIAGELRGDLELEGTLELTSSGQLYGDIAVANLIVGEGASFQGNCKMQATGSKGQKKRQLRPGEEKTNEA
jgi:cytoskeletal protein CcmA (bactofilin family)